jgi:signal transduction histidine kinase/ActR/RegA family two-component response regulator
MFGKLIAEKPSQKLLEKKLLELEALSQRQSEMIKHLQAQVSGSFSADFKDFPGFALKISFEIAEQKTLKLEFASAGSIKYLKATPQMLHSDPFLGLQALTDFHRRRLIRKLTQSTHNLQPFSIDVSCRSETGTYWLNVSVSTSVMKGRIYWQFIALDITEIKKAKFLAVESNEVKLLFMSKLSHTLRNPLNTIMGYAQLLHTSHAEDFESQTDIENILRGCERIDMVLKDLFDVTNLELGVFELHENNFYLIDLLSSLNCSYEKQATDKGIEVLFVSEVPLVQVCADETRLKQALANLLSGAIDRSSEGKVNFSCKSQLQDSSLHSTILINDSGVELDQDLIDRIFNPRASLLDVANQTLGKGEAELRVVREIVEKLGGSLGISSDSSTGNTFQVRLSLPISNTAGVIQTKEEKENSEPLKVLVVDDSVTNRRILVSYLEQKRHQVIESANGLDAIKTARDFVPDVIFMDLDMPGMSGLNASVAIRNLESAARDAFIVATTGQVFDSDQRAAREAGMDDFLAKPYNFKKVNEILKHFSYE